MLMDCVMRVKMWPRMFSGSGDVGFELNIKGCGRWFEMKE